VLQIYDGDKRKFVSLNKKEANVLFGSGSPKSAGKVLPLLMEKERLKMLC